MPDVSILSTTSSNEKKLLKLQLPDLPSTLDQVKESLEPLYYTDGYYKHPLDPGQINSLNDSLSTFQNSDVAKKLTAKLQEFNEKNDCYLDKLYLDINNNYNNNHNNCRNIPNDILPRNPFLILMDDVVPNISQADYSAVLVNSSLRFISALKKGILPQDTSKNGEILSMEAYLNLFGTTRCPIFEKGEIENFDLNKKFNESDIEVDADDEDEVPISDEHDDVFISTSECNDDTDLDSPDDCIGTKTVNTLDADVTLSKGGNNVESSSKLINKHGITMKQDLDSRHLVVLSRGQYYKIDVLDEFFDRLYTTDDLAAIFKSVLDDSSSIESLEKSTALGSLTSHSYKNWKYARKRLTKRYPNQMKIIDSALFILVLDESTKEQTKQINFKNNKNPNKYTIYNESNECKRLFYGTSIINEKGHQIGSCVSRWYDKLQLVITSDSQAAVIWDSFTCDGSTVLRFSSDLYAESILRLAREVNGGDQRFSLWPNIKNQVPGPTPLSLGTSSSSSSSSISDTSATSPKLNKLVHKIDWQFSNILNTHIHLSETKLADLISKYDIVHVSIPYGKRLAKKLGVKSDAMIQIALQIAHYALYGKMVFGVEPISTRGFKNSRGDLVNIQNKELLKLCQLFISNSIDETSKLENFIESCNLHSEKIKSIKKNGGYEKHFNALKYLFKYYKQFNIDLNKSDLAIASEVFNNEVFDPFFTPELIVSNCGSSATKMFGITPEIANGFGIGYILKDDKCDLTVTSQFRQGNRLIFTLDWVLGEIYNYWKISKSITGIRINPLVDRLYNLDNAKKVSNKDPQPISDSIISPNNTMINLTDEMNRVRVINGGYGFFDLEAHLDSRNISHHNSNNNSCTSLNMLKKTNSKTIFNLSDKDKINTGHQIISIKPEVVSDDPDLPFNSRPGTKRQNVINSKFEIDFDRGSVGRKVSSMFE
ncbi:hypothetical protein TBLA_0F02910 [Henningerozyma blattae CBS 6284]|uniref:Choline/carnitine acyltransferase domain-containing protein n=1 Tax=Henningerozyma blattae (strain ATCC 34711 / CBS 6284 / DSM 70876 / NBRC 10599 / NRRL Y-10934 / UCD 77-7) TaxID=1071380 RepID=I2H628_HENB6|nr:hypothetical protein TBLA_0F02910 [Tetrapisispora blattae CBS 6284]CCH61830.1 hypothetical protein TBLA_0F02910 [Tetrapisispora blattae CBS 6284]